LKNLMGPRAAGAFAHSERPWGRERKGRQEDCGLAELVSSWPVRPEGNFAARRFKPLTGPPDDLPTGKKRTAVFPHRKNFTPACGCGSSHGQIARSAMFVFAVVFIYRGGGGGPPARRVRACRSTPDMTSRAIYVVDGEVEIEGPLRAGAAALDFLAGGPPPTGQGRKHKKTLRADDVSRAAMRWEGPRLFCGNLLLLQERMKQGSAGEERSGPLSRTGQRGGGDRVPFVRLTGVKQKIPVFLVFSCRPRMRERGVFSKVDPMGPRFVRQATCPARPGRAEG